MTTGIDRGLGAFCPSCGANVRAETTRCWLCFWPLPPIKKGPSLTPAEIHLVPTAAHETDSIRRGPPRAATRQFSLATILLTITLIAVCLGVYHHWPGLGVLVAAMATPALIGTIALGAGRRQRGLPMTTTDKIVAFFAMFGVLFLVLISAVAALLVACGYLALGMEGMQGRQWIVGLLIVIAIGTISIAVPAIGMLARFIQTLRS